MRITDQSSGGPIAILQLLALWVLVPGLRGADGDVFRPGEIWLDTAGQPMNAHGGGMLYHQGRYYWYGENKQGRTWLPESTKAWDGYRVDVTGIRCYSSRDLYHWTDAGLVLKAVPNDPAHDLHPSKVCERLRIHGRPVEQDQFGGLAVPVASARVPGQPADRPVAGDLGSYLFRPRQTKRQRGAACSQSVLRDSPLIEPFQRLISGADFVEKPQGSY